MLSDKNCLPSKLFLLTSLCHEIGPRSHNNKYFCRDTYHIVAKIKTLAAAATTTTKQTSKQNKEVKTESLSRYFIVSHGESF